jgi:hypothetical protein
VAVPAVADGGLAVADPDQEFSFNDGEIVEARWFTRDQVRAALAAGDWTNAETSDSELLLPGSVSIARAIIESWAHPEHPNNSASGRVCTPTRRCGCTNADARPDGSAQ